MQCRVFPIDSVYSRCKSNTRISELASNVQPIKSRLATYWLDDTIGVEIQKNSLLLYKIQLYILIHFSICMTG